jgi:hypothetical protein
MPLTEKTTAVPWARVFSSWWGDTELERPVAAAEASNLNFFADDLDMIAIREGIRFSYHILTKRRRFSKTSSSPNTAGRCRWTRTWR